MKNYFGFTAKSVVKLLCAKTIIWADEPADPPADPPKPNPINYEDLISKARKEEKDKLYPQIDGLKKDKDALVEKCNTHLLTIAGKDEKIQELLGEIEKMKTSKGTSESEELANLRKENKKLEKQIKDMQDNAINPEEFEKKIREQVSGEYEIKLYREEKLRETGDACIPELVFGSTKEEIDASLEKSKERYTQITGKVTSTKINNVPPANPGNNPFGDKEINIEAIQNMPMKDWAEERKKLGLR